MDFTNTNVIRRRNSLQDDFVSLPSEIAWAISISNVHNGYRKPSHLAVSDQLAFWYRKQLLKII